MRTHPRALRRVVVAKRPHVAAARSEMKSVAIAGIVGRMPEGCRWHADVVARGGALGLRQGRVRSRRGKIAASIRFPAPA
jgi:hypothetical protein